MTLRHVIIERLNEAGGRGSAATDPAPIDDYSLNPQPLPRRQPPKPAAVLIPLVERQEGMSVLLTQRTDHLHDHAGQVSFPGGRVEEQDEDFIDTALRETEEEIGLERRFVEIAGVLEPYETVSGFRIMPVVGLVESGFTLTLDSFEVAAAFEIPLQLALAKANYERRSRTFRGATRHFYVLPHDERFIWGATAGILYNLCSRLDGIIDPAG